MPSRSRPTRSPVRLALALVGAGAVVTSAVLVTGPLTASAAPPDAYAVKGFDTSHHNHGDGETEPIDYKAAADSGRKFVFLKATQGVDYEDPWFARDFEAAADAGLMRAPYHFFDPASAGDAAQQAEHFAKTAKDAGYTGKQAGELPPALDFEPVQGACPAHTDAEAVKSTLDAVRDAFDVEPVVYTSKAFVEDCLGGDGSAFAGHKLWQPRYGSGENEPADIPGADASWTFWQHDESAEVPGVPSAGEDANVFRGTEAELRALAHADGGDGAAGSGSGSGPAAASAPRAAKDVSRATMLKRARGWLTANDGAQVPYSQSKVWSDGYRQDCSGYVSMTLGLSKSGPNTQMLASDRDLTEPVPLKSLKPGDLLIDADGSNTTRHVVVFDGWTSDARTAYKAYEQRGGHGTDHRVLKYGLDEGSEFKPYRPVNLTD